GGLVTSTGSALAVPDWPTTFGYNMFLYPISGMVGGILYEHSHRLLGALVGFLTIILTLWLWREEPRPWLRWLGNIALAGVILQGVLGGMRVVLLAHTLAIVHACLAQAFFGLLVAIAFFTSPARPGKHTEYPLQQLGRLRCLSVSTTALIYVQVISGAILRHTGVRLDAHVVLAGLVAIHVLVLAMHIWRHSFEDDQVVRPIMLLCALLIAQLSLGLGAYLVKYTAMAAMATPFVRVSLTTVHLAVGSLLLATSLVLTLRTYRLGTTASPIAAGQLFSPQVPS
ncbi:MAG TPA: COX15/CtaA family protein, partial [Candidatus Tectomicrobia bacterium]|nr:COX15/CtaA family protein [Candidatus Tectomicrobia bacterium]